MQYQQFLDALVQLEQDQSLFEAEVGNELQGIHHENLVRTGGKMAKKLRVLANLGQSFAESLPPDMIAKIIDAIQDYVGLLVPKKVFGGFCPCFKPSREGPEYDRRLLTAYTKVIYTLYISQAAVIEYSAEKLNMESMHFADYSNRLNTLHTTLAAISTKGGDKVREGARVELQAAVEAVNRFMKSFEEETIEFRPEVNRRLGKVNELLSTRPADGSAISRRLLVSAQASLQEIMNSAAMVSGGKARTSLEELDKLTLELKDAWDSETSTIEGIATKLHENMLSDMLNRLREDSEVANSDTNTRIREATRRWNTVRNQSAPRPVVEYQEDVPLANSTGDLLNMNIANIPNNVQGGLNNVINGEIDPEKLLKETGKKLGNVSKKAAMNVEKGAFKIFSAIETGFQEITGVNTGPTPVSVQGGSQSAYAQRPPQAAIQQQQYQYQYTQQQQQQQPRSQPQSVEYVEQPYPYPPQTQTQQPQQQQQGGGGSVLGAAKQGLADLFNPRGL